MHVVGLLWLIGVCVGHTSLLIWSINWWYGLALPHRFLFCLRLFFVGLILLGVATFSWSYVHSAWSVEAFSAPGLAHPAAHVYVLVCGLIGLVGLPLLTLWRLCRGRPAALLSNHTATVDVAARLGYKPVGHGKYHVLAHLPGNEIFRVDFAERTLALPQLPAAWDGLTILHLTDLHLKGTPDRMFYQDVMDLCSAWQPDLIAITGDIVDSHHHHRWIVPVLGRLGRNVPAFAVLGNHDARYEPDVVRKRLRRIGVQVLGNSWAQLEVRGVPLLIIGNEAPWFRPAPDLTACPQGPFRLCLSHTPDNIRWARRHGINLMLAGHNHGGQIRFPILGSVIVPSCYGRRYDCGTFDEPPALLHVGRGLGGTEPVRYNCRPEVAKLVLRCKQDLV
jgi:predicted MPP superfamily phosphohydrolase